MYAVNRSQSQGMTTLLQLTSGNFKSKVTAFTVNGPDIKAENTFTSPDLIGTRETTLHAREHTLDVTFEPHSVTALVSDIS